MIYRPLLLLAVLTMLATPALAQTCGNLLPCVPIPWTLPDFPALNSPTPMPMSSSIVITVSPDPSETADPNPGSNPTPTPIWDAADLSDQVATIQALNAATPYPILGEDGQPLDRDTVALDLATNAVTTFGYFKALSQVQFGVLSPLVTFIFLGFSFMFLVKLARWAAPVVRALVNLVIRAIEILLEFIPG